MKKDRRRKRSRSRSKERSRDSKGTERKLQKMQSQLDNLTNVLSQIVKIKEKDAQQEVANEKITFSGKKAFIPYG